MKEFFEGPGWFIVIGVLSLALAYFVSPLFLIVLGADLAIWYVAGRIG